MTSTSRLVEYEGKSQIICFKVDGICESGQSGTVKNGGVENAGVNKSARCGKDGFCRSGQRGTMWQRWTMQEWTYRHDMSRVDSAGEKRVQVSLTETMLYYT